MENIKEFYLSTTQNRESVPGTDGDEVTSFSVAEMTGRLEQADQARQQIRKLTMELRTLGLQLRQKKWMF